MAQGFLPFPYESERGLAGETSRAGLLVFVGLFRALGLLESVRDEVGVRRNRLGYTDWRVVLALRLLNLAGGDGVADLDVLEGDAGFCRAHRALETHGLTRRERKGLGARLALPFPTLEMGAVHYKLFGVVTNRDGDGDERLPVIPA